ncbi:hypothetical protein AB4Z51_13405 [Bradyrhizobium sp. 2TAF36]|uniref:hypothetical protein n=1 Tax=Bradyrhizobium sp. 2TAF36 TaxID=3233016 RepID=UPI003F923F8E
MKPTNVPGLLHLQNEAHELRNAFELFTRRLDALVIEQTKDAPATGPADWKRADGRLNDAGISAMEAMFAAGRSVSQIAETFKIAKSAASHRKQIWRARTGAQG